MKNEIKQYTFPNGYKHIRYNRKAYLVHRLVAECFVFNNDVINNTIVNHKDENKSNNVYTNLEWCDKSYNVHYGNCIDKISKNNSKSRIFKYDIFGNIVSIYNNANQINNKTIQSAISKNFKNRYFDGYYYFKENEYFDANRKTNIFKVSVIKNNIIVFKGNIKALSEFINCTYSNTKRIVSKYSHGDTFYIKDNLIKLEIL